MILKKKAHFPKNKVNQFEQKFSKFKNNLRRNLVTKNSKDSFGTQNDQLIDEEDQNVEQGVVTGSVSAYNNSFQVPPNTQQLQNYDAGLSFFSIKSGLS